MEVLAKRDTWAFQPGQILPILSNEGRIECKPGSPRPRLNDRFRRTRKDKVMMGKERKSNASFQKMKRTIRLTMRQGTPSLPSWHRNGPSAQGQHYPARDGARHYQQLQLMTDTHIQENTSLNTLAVLLGGRAAEEIALGHMTTGAGNGPSKGHRPVKKNGMNGDERQIGPHYVR